MSDELNSQLSAFVDDELAPEESELLVRRLCRDDVLRDTAASYALIGDVLRDEQAVTASPDFARRVMMAVDGQAIPEVDTVKSRPDNAARNRGIAIAASVMLAAIAFLTLPDRNPSVPEIAEVAEDADALSAPIVAATENLASTPVAALAVLPGTTDSRPVRFDVPMTVPVTRHSAENQARLNNLLLRHLNETGATRQGLVTYRNVGFVRTGNER